MAGAAYARSQVPQAASLLDDWHVCEFTYIHEGNPPRSVELVCDMNGWQHGSEPEAMAMELVPGTTGTYVKRLALLDGYYRYKFLVDGEYRADSRFNMREHFGMGNSVMRVGLAHVGPEAIGSGEALRFYVPQPGAARRGAFHVLWDDVSVDWAACRGVESRPMFVYLPPSYYSSPTRRFPVCYVLDGSMAFSTENGVALDSAADALAAESAGAMECIIVGIPSREVTRKQDLCPRVFLHVDVAPFTRLLVDGIKPFIDRTYRTRSEPASTVLMGSSFAGLFSFCATISMPDVFGVGLCLSPSLWFHDFAGNSVTDFLARCGAHTTALGRVRLYLSAGSDADDMAQLLETQYVARVLADDYGMAEEGRLLFRRVEHGAHNERAWRERVGEALRFALDAHVPASVLI